MPRLSNQELAELLEAASKELWVAQRDGQGRMKIAIYDNGHRTDSLEGWYDLAEFFIDPVKRDTDEANARLAAQAPALARKVLDQREAGAAMAEAIEHGSLVDEIDAMDAWYKLADTEVPDDLINSACRCCGVGIQVVPEDAVDLCPACYRGKSGDTDARCKACEKEPPR